MTMTNEFVYMNFVQQDYNIEQSQKVINDAKNDISKFDDKKASYFSMNYYKNKIQEFRIVASDAADRMVDLIIAYIFQTLLFPLIFLFILYKIILSFLHIFIPK